MTEATYDALLARARTALELGESVVLDASWSSDQHRRAARLTAETTASDMVELCCVVPANVAEQRIMGRLATGGDPSDATPAVAAVMAQRFDAWPEVVAVDTARPLDLAVAQAMAALAG